MPRVTTGNGGGGLPSDLAVSKSLQQRQAAEAWRRAGAGELSALYPGDAQWAGLYDRMIEREEDETGRRFQIAADHGAFRFSNHEKHERHEKGKRHG